MNKPSHKKWSRSQLLAYGLPAVLIPGVIFALSLGFNPRQLLLSKSYETNEKIFPSRGIVAEVKDGDTFTLGSGVEVRLLGVNAPDRGSVGFASAASALRTMISSQTVDLEYDRYQDDKYGRVLAWVWMSCDEKPKFAPAQYMHKSGNLSKEGILENPVGCNNGVLINEELVRRGVATQVKYKERGPLKYEERISRVIQE